MLLGLLLLLFGTWLMPSVDPNAKRDDSEQRLSFPRYPSLDDYKTMKKRRTLPGIPRPVVDAGADSDEPRPPKRDPLLVALPPQGDILVFEVSAFMKRPVGRMLAACLTGENGPTIERDGFDLSSLERVAFGGLLDGSGEIAVVTGDIASGGMPTRLRDVVPRTYGDHASIYEREGDAPGDDGDPRFFATWNNELAIIGDREADITAAVDRLEGRDNTRSTFMPDDAYGELYGRMSANTAMKMLPYSLRQKIPDTDLQVSLHADANQDVLVVADAYGIDENSIDIGKTLAAALGATRFQAAASGDQRLSELLDAFAVDPADDGFQLRAAFTQEMVEEALGECARRAQATDGAGQAAAGSGG